MEITIKTDVRKLLIGLREQHKYSLQKLEELSGISHSTLHRYEINQGTDLTLGKLEAIARVYGLKLSVRFEDMTGGDANGKCEAVEP